eukprot:COSAG03_NODE_25186_length_267_cov_0.619048_1_plen_55_part_01
MNCPTEATGEAPASQQRPLPDTAERAVDSVLDESVSTAQSTGQVHPVKGAIEATG